ncbi:hypothetical protein BHE74_00056932 [Ensete ventricosum]|nr:hypothetical protein BHE74_00056932 [Ensete ventricosum]
MQGRDNASFSHRKTKHHLVFQLRDKATPRLAMGTRHCLSAEKSTFAVLPEMVEYGLAVHTGLRVDFIASPSKRKPSSHLRRRRLTVTAAASTMWLPRRHRYFPGMRPLLFASSSYFFLHFFVFFLFFSSNAPYTSPSFSSSLNHQNAPMYCVYSSGIMFADEIPLKHSLNAIDPYFVLRT